MSTGKHPLRPKPIKLGRLPMTQVLSAMKATYQERAPLQYAEQAKRQTFENLMEQWYLDVVAPRAQETPIRAEYKLSKHTVLNYHNTKKQLDLLAPNLLLDDLNAQRLQELVSALQRKYAQKVFL